MSTATASRARASGPLLWLTVALIALPFVQALPLDFDRSAPLFLLLPALWSGRACIVSALASVGATCRWFLFLGSCATIATVLAVVTSDHPAPAAVTVGSWVLLLAAGLLAGQLVRENPATGARLLAAIALSSAAGTAAVWVSWSLGGRGAMPLYAHHRHLGLHALTGAVASTALLAGPSSFRRTRILWGLIGAIAWAGMLWSGGRGPILAAACGLGVWCWFGSPELRRRLLVSSAVHFVAGLALSACFWTSRAELGWWHAFERTAAAVSTEHSVDVSQLTSTRSEFWRAAAQHAMQMPWLGHGPDAYRFITPKLDGQQPHNFLLQFWLDLGLLGAVPVAILVGAVLWMSWKNMRATSDSDLGPWTALFTALLALGLLDGVFYHVLTLLPAAIAFGVMLRAGVANEPAAVTRVSRTVVTVGLSGAVALLAVHSWLFHRLVVAPPPENPNATAARVLRAFPSTTFGLWRWLDQWQQGDLETALVWTRWAQAHATNPALFHVRAAQYLQARGETAAALEELRAAEAKAHWTSRPGIAALRQSMLNSR